MLGKSNQYMVLIVDSTATALVAVPTGATLVFDFIIGSAVNSSANVGGIVLVTKDDDSTAVIRFPQSVNNAVTTTAVGWNYSFARGLRMVDSAGNPVNFQVSAANRAHVSVTAGLGTLSSQNIAIGYHFEY